MFEEAGTQIEDVFDDLGNLCPGCGLPFGHSDGCSFALEQAIQDCMNRRYSRTLAESKLRQGKSIETPIETAEVAKLLYGRAGLVEQVEFWEQVLRQLQARQSIRSITGLPRRSASILACFLLVAGVQAVRDREASSRAVRDRHKGVGR
jgi:hypothetical protein